MTTAQWAVLAIAERWHRGRSKMFGDDALGQFHADTADALRVLLDARAAHAFAREENHTREEPAR